MRISIVVEGKTEKAFKPTLLRFLQTRLPGKMPKLDFVPRFGRIEKGDELKELVANLLQGENASQHVIVLTDVYTGTDDFRDAGDAKAKMRKWVGDDNRFTPHVAKYEFEAWLLPYWDKIKRLAGHNKAAPKAQPENVNHGKPPSHHIKELFAVGTSNRCYSKTRDGLSILRNVDLGTSLEKCPELKAFVNTILRLSGGSEID